jgi:hypothetical protein
MTPRELYRAVRAQLASPEPAPRSPLGCTAACSCNQLAGERCRQSRADCNRGVPITSSAAAAAVIGWMDIAEGAGEIKPL